MNWKYTQKSFMIKIIIIILTFIAKKEVSFVQPI
jgi:hypothetical protein